MSDQGRTNEVLHALLSDIDAEGLTASALQTSLTKIEMRKEELLMNLFAGAADTYASHNDEDADHEEEPTADTATILSQELSCSTAIAALTAHNILSTSQQQQQESNNDVPTDDPTHQLTHLAAQDADLCSQLIQAQQEAASVRLAAEFQQRLTELDANMQRGAFTESAWIAVELQKSAAVAATARQESLALSLDQQQPSLSSFNTTAQLSTIEATTSTTTSPTTTTSEQQSRQPSLSFLEAMESAIEKRIAPLKHRLINTAPNCIAIELPTMLPVLRKPTEASAAQLQEILTAAEVLNIVDEVLKTLSGFLVHRCFEPMIKGIILVPKNVPAPPPPPPEARQAVEKLLYKGLKSVCELILSDNPTLITQLGSTLWPAIADIYIDVKLRPYEPSTEAQLDTFSKRGTLAQKVEQKAIKLGLTPEAAAAVGGGGGPIGRYVRGATAKVLNAQKGRYIARVRDLMTSVEAQETVTVVSGTVRKSGASRALFDNEKEEQPTTAITTQHPQLNVLTTTPPFLDDGTYIISKAAQGVVTAMQDALTEAITSGSAPFAHAMCAAVVDMAAVAVALPPLSSSSSSSTSSYTHNTQQQHNNTSYTHQHDKDSPLLLPFPAAVRYNDLHYIHTMLCMMPYMFTPKLQHILNLTSTTNSTVDFIATAARVEQAANQTLFTMLQRQREELFTIAAEFQAFSRGLDGPKVIKCKKAVMQLLHAFRRLGSVLRGVLMPMKLMEVAGVLIDRVCEYICDIIVSMQDISVDQAEQIPSILGDLTFGLYDTIIPPSTSTTNTTTSSSSTSSNTTADIQRQREALQKWTPSLEKLVTLSWILDARMKDIYDRWHSGRLASAGFTDHQIMHLIEALFEDTDLRREILAQLKKESGTAASTTIKQGKRPAQGGMPGSGDGGLKGDEATTASRGGGAGRGGKESIRLLGKKGLGEIGRGLGKVAATGWKLSDRLSEQIIQMTTEHQQKYSENTDDED